MSESKHTPGPWGITADKDEHGEIRTYVGAASSNFPNMYSKYVAKIMGWGMDYANDSEQKANARLIAAAPDLLAALKKWREFMVNNYTPEELSWWGETEAAIAKAEGDQS